MSEHFSDTIMEMIDLSYTYTYFILYKDLYFAIALNLNLFQICEFHAWKPFNQVTQEKNFTFTEESGGGGAMSYELCETHRIS